MCKAVLQDRQSLLADTKLNAECSLKKNWTMGLNNFFTHLLCNDTAYCNFRTNTQHKNKYFNNIHAVHCACSH